MKVPDVSVTRYIRRNPRDAYAARAKVSMLLSFAAFSVFIALTQLSRDNSRTFHLAVESHFTPIKSTLISVVSCLATMISLLVVSVCLWWRCPLRSGVQRNVEFLQHCNSIYITSSGRLESLFFVLSQQLPKQQ